MGSKLIQGYKSSLVESVDRNVAERGRSATLRRQINRASSDFFCPQIWLLDLDGIAGRKNVSVDDFLDECRRAADSEVSKIPGQVLQPDEYLIRDLQPGEYAVVVNG